MARRSYSSDEPEVDAHAEATPTDVTPPLTEQQIKLNELDAYYSKVLGDLAREMREATAVHDASEKRMADIEAQKVQIDAEYAERKLAIEGEPPPEGGVLAAKPPTRWGVAPAPKPQPTYTA
jgi:hypothetical protein